MNAIKSLDDLKKIREEALAKRKVSETSGATHVVVAMGTCGIAAGARETMKAVLDYIEEKNLPDIVVTQTGCLGLCEQEPIMQVVSGQQEKVTYGKVSPEVARQIMQEHVEKGEVVADHVIPMVG
jgi:NADP-reducing hydrogenase subunit HndB